MKNPLSLVQEKSTLEIQHIKVADICDDLWMQGNLTLGEALIEIQVKLEEKSKKEEDQSSSSNVLKQGQKGP